MKYIAKFRMLLMLCALLCVLLPCFAAFSGCGGGSNDSRPALSVWVYSDEYARQLERAFDSDMSAAAWRLDITVVTAAELDNRIAQAAEKNELPDVFMLSPDSLRKYVDSDLTADLGELGISYSPSTYYSYTTDAATDDTGVLKAACWQPDPGLFFYRRSLAKAYLGTDSPDEVGEKLSDWDGFLAAARSIRELSRGKTYMVVGIEDMMRAYLGSDPDGWESDGRMALSSAAADFLDYAKTMADEELIYDAEQWSASWVAGISDPQSVFGYFSSGLGMKDVLKKACGGSVEGYGSYADWACIEGPSPYNWGGCWFAVSASSDMKKQASVFLEYFTCEKEAMERNFLIDGAFSANRSVVETIKFDSQFGDPFLAGQNYYAVQAKVADDITMARLTERAPFIDNAFSECVRAYVFDGQSRDDALSDFAKRVQAVYPELF